MAGASADNSEAGVESSEWAGDGAVGLAEPPHGEEEEKSTPRMPPWFLEEMDGRVGGEELEEGSWVEI